MNTLLAELINAVDTDRAEEQAWKEEMWKDVVPFITHMRTTAKLSAWDIVAGRPQWSTTWFGMILWPNYSDLKSLLGETVLTLTAEQATVLLSSVFHGNTTGTIRMYGWLFTWNFHYREDGWVELTVKAV